MSEKGTFMIATLVDWNNADQLEKTWKKISKIYKKKLRGNNPKKNQLNTFVVTEVELDKLPSRLDRIKVEQEVNKLLKQYADSIHDAHYDYVKRQGTIAGIYERGLKSQGREDLFLKYTEAKAQKFEKIESEIERVGAEGGVIIWDLPGFEADKIILPETVATFSDYPKDSETLVDIVDEVLIANFARRFLPFSNELIKEAVEGFKRLETLTKQFGKDESVKRSLIIPLQTFIGVISGIQEVLKLFKREVAKVHDVATVAFNYLKELPSDDMKEWATIRHPELGNEILSHIDSVMKIIVDHKPELRKLLTGDKKLNDESCNHLLETMIEMDVISGVYLLGFIDFNNSLLLPH